VIIEWFLGLVAGVIDWIGSLLPDWSVPPDLAAPGGIVSEVMGYGSALGVFIDWGACIVVGLLPLGVWVVGVLFRAAKTAASHIPWFGGN
jgi:hypothetical protein